MIYDSVENLARYRFLSDHIRAIEEHIERGIPLPPACRVQRGGGTPTVYDGQLTAHSEAHLFHRIIEGREVIAIGYSEQERAEQADGAQTVVIEGAQVASVVTLEAGHFILLMPGEPYALSLLGSSSGHEGESIWFV